VPETKQDLIPQARAMYAQLLTIQDIADGLGVAPSTVRRWKAADAQAGMSWDADRAARGYNPRALIAILEKRLAAVAADEKLKPGPWADVVQKISNVLNRERERLGDLTVVLGILSGFAAWTAADLDDEQFRAVSRAIDAYLSHLKERNL